MQKHKVLFLITMLILMAFTAPKNDFTYYFQKGFKAVEIGNHSAAIYYLDSAIALNPEADSAYSLIAYPYFSMGMSDKAIEYANKAIDINPNNALAYYVRGISIGSINVYSDSLIKVIKKHRKDSVWLSNNIRNRYFFAEPAEVGYSGIYDYAKAIKDINKSLKLDSTYAYVYDFRAYFHKWMKQYDKAKADYDKCIELQPENPYYYLSRGEVCEKYGRPDWSMDDYTKGIELDSNMAVLYEKRGLLYYHTFIDQEYACKDLTKATLLGRYIENLDTYCTISEYGFRYYGGRRWRHDYVPRGCVCPNFKDMFNPETDTIREIEMPAGSGNMIKMLDIKDSEKTTWDFGDGRIMEISKETKRRWLKEEEEKRQKELLNTP